MPALPGERPPVMSDHPPYGRRIKALRIAEGISQSALSARVGMSVQRLSDIEVERKATSLETVIAIADAMGWPLASIDDRFATPAELVRRKGKSPAVEVLEAGLDPEPKRPGKKIRPKAEINC